MGLSSQTLEALGYDPTEEVLLTVENICGAAIHGYVIHCGGRPGDDAEIDLIVTQANCNLLQHGFNTQVDRAYIGSLLLPTETE